MAQRLSDVMSAPVDESAEPKSMRLGDVMSLSPVEYSTEEEADLFASGVVAVPSAEDRQSFKSRGPIGVFESFARNAKPYTFIPVVGAVTEGVKSANILTATGRLQANDYKDNFEQRNKDAQLLSDEIRNRVEEQDRGYSWGGKITNVLKEMPAVMAEFMATGGVATSGRMVARKGAEAVLKRATDKAVTRIVTKKVAGTVGSIAARTAALGSYKVPVGMTQKAVDERISLSDKGVRIYEAGKTKPFTSLMKSVGDVAFEIASEQAGGTIRKVASAALAPVAKAVAPVTARLADNRMVKAVSMLADKLKVGGLAKEMADKAKFDGILEEYGEERWGNFLRAVANVDDFGSGDNSSVMDRVIASIPSMEESLVELAAFSVPAVGFAGASFYNRVRADNSKGVDDALISKVADEILIDQGIKEAPVSVNTTPEMKGAPESINIVAEPVQPKMIEKEFIEEYEEAPESLDKEYARAHKERTEQFATMLSSDPDLAGKKRKGRGYELSATLRQYRGEPTAIEIKNETKKLKAMTVGKTVETSEGIGVIKKNPAYGKVQVEVNGKSKAYLMEDVAPIKVSKEDAIASLKAKAEKDMTKYLKDIGREYKPQSIKRTRIVKRMVPAEQEVKKTIDVEDTAPVMDEKSDDQIRAQELANYLGGTEDNSGLIFSDQADGSNQVIGAAGTERPRWWSGLGMSMARTVEVLEKFANGQKMTDVQLRDFNTIMDAGGRRDSESMVDENYLRFLKRKNAAIKAGATEDEAISFANSDAEQDLMDAAGIVDDESWVEGIPVESAPVLDTPKIEEKISKASSDIVMQMVEDGFKDLSDTEQAKYSPIEKKAKLGAAAKLLSSDYELAKRIAFGEVPSGMADAQIVYNAVKIRARAEGDMDTQMRLAESPVAKARSEAAQALRAAGFDNGNKDADPVAAMQDIASIRLKEIPKKLDVKKETASGVKNIKEMTKQELKKMDWDGFVSSIQC